MPYLTGGTLADRVARHGPAPVEEVDAAGRRLGSALAAAHRAGVVHRDIKPANVLFDADGRAAPGRLRGGQLARRHRGADRGGHGGGHPGFMAPEQARGEDAGQAADVFSLGATLLFAATGEGPYGARRPRPADGPRRPGQGPARVPRPCRSALRRGSRRCSTPVPSAGPARPPWRAGPTAPRWPARSPPAPALAGVGGRRRPRRRRGGGGAGRRRPGRPTTRPTVHDGPRDDRRTVHRPPLPGVRREASRPRTPTAGVPGRLRRLRRSRRQRLRGRPDGLADGTAADRRRRGHHRAPRRRRHLRHARCATSGQLLCDGELRLTLTAPAGVTLRLEVLDGGEVLRPDHERRRGARVGHPARARVPLRRRHHARRPGCPAIGSDRTCRALPAGAARQSF